MSLLNFTWPNFNKTLSIALLLNFVLIGCSSQPTVRIQYVNVPTYIPSPSTLTAPTQVILGDSPTWGSALGAYKAGVDSCNADKAALGSLKTPSSPPPSPPYK